MLFICYEKCSTCRKAQAFLDEHHISYTIRPIKEENPTQAELQTWQKTSGLPLRKFFNTSGQKYRELGLKDKLSTMSEAEQLSLLSSDGMLVKRPILIGENFVLVGFQSAQWESQLQKS